MISPTLAEVVRSARELSFDRFVTPAFFITGKSTGQLLAITSTSIAITTPPSTPEEDPITFTLPFADNPTLEDIALVFITEGYPFSYAASFVGSEPSNSLLPVSSELSLSPTALYRKYFFSDAEVMEVMRRYLTMECGYSYAKAYEVDLLTEVTKLSNAVPHHMALWCAYWLVERRRIYELASEVIGQSTFSGTGDAGMLGILENGSSINVNLADVFSLTDNPQSKFNEGEKSWGVGADNVLGDASGFWYRLQLWIRSQLERLFGDFSLRPDQVIMGVMSLEKDTNFYAYYDQYPYTISPLSREILSSFSP